VSTTDTVDAQLASTAQACATADAFEQADILNQAWKAIVELPVELRQVFLPGFPSAGRFAQLLTASAHETAAIELLGNGLGYIASRSPDGNHIATVSGPGGAEFTEVADTLALGLVAGLVKLLQVLLREHSGTTLARH